MRCPPHLILKHLIRSVVSLGQLVYSSVALPAADMEKVESLPPADLHFQISALVKFQIQAFILDFSASTASLLETFSMSG